MVAIPKATKQSTDMRNITWVRDAIAGNWRIGNGEGNEEFHFIDHIPPIEKGNEINAVAPQCLSSSPRLLDSCGFWRIRRRERKKQRALLLGGKSSRREMERGIGPSLPPCEQWRREMKKTPTRLGVSSSPRPTDNFQKMFSLAVHRCRKFLKQPSFGLSKRRMNISTVSTTFRKFQRRYFELNIETNKRVTIFKEIKYWQEQVKRLTTR